MPFRNSYLRDADGCLDLTTPRRLVDTENNVFDKAFNGVLDMEEWDNWMKWEGTTEMEVPSLYRKDSKDSITSTASSPETWSVGMNHLSTSYSTESGFNFNDAPFEFEESQNVNELSTRQTRSSNTQGPQDTRRSFSGFSSLTEAEEQSLQDIAMPYRMLSKVKISSEPSSPAISHSSPSPSPSPEPEVRTRKSKKRKSLTDDGEIPNALSQSRKRGHNAIEKRYRTNLNQKINCLRDGVPALSRTASGDSKSDDEAEDSDAEGADGKNAQQKYGKAAILTRALEYIKHLESTTNRLGSEVSTLKTRVGAFEKLAMSGSIVLNSGNGWLVPTAQIIKTETLKTIQEDFQQIRPVKPSAPQTRKRGSKQAKDV
jgi:hypothetical protein